MGLAKLDGPFEGPRFYRTMDIFDHFSGGFAPGSTAKWQTGTTGGSSSVSLSTTLTGGQLVLTAGATQNYEAWLYTPVTLFEFAASQPQIAMCCLNYTEGNVNLAGIAFGFASSWTHILADTTYALPSSYSGALIYKVPGATTWSCAGSVGTTQFNQTCNNNTQNAAIPQLLAIQAMIDANSDVELTFWAGAVGYAGSGTPGPNYSYTPMYPNTTSMAKQQQQKFFIPYASAAAMQLGIFLKSGDPGGTAETLYLDCIGGDFLSVP